MDWEFYILNYIQNNYRNDFLDKLMPFISTITQVGAVWVVFMIITFFIPKHRRLGFMMLCNFALSLLICTVILKPIVSRIRPYELNSYISLIVRPEIDPSFPSGHSFFAFSCATTCFIYNKKLGLLMYALAFLVAASRLYLYVHFPTDVFFGIVFGTVTAIVSYCIFREIESFRKTGLHHK